MHSASVMSVPFPKVFIPCILYIYIFFDSSFLPYKISLFKNTLASVNIPFLKFVSPLIISKNFLLSKICPKLNLLLVIISGKVFFESPHCLKMFHHVHTILFNFVWRQNTFQFCHSGSNFNMGPKWMWSIFRFQTLCGYVVRHTVLGLQKLDHHSSRTLFRCGVFL